MIQCTNGEITLTEIITELNNKLDTVKYIPTYSAKAYPAGTLIKKPTANGVDLLVSGVHTSISFVDSEWNKIDINHLGQLKDITITNPAQGDILVYDNNVFKNKQVVQVQSDFKATQGPAYIKNKPIEVVSITQAAYDALQSKDQNTLYVIG